MSARTLAGTALGVAYLYLAWLGWKDVLVPPQPPGAESEAFVHAAHDDVPVAADARPERDDLRARVSAADVRFAAQPAAGETAPGEALSAYSPSRSSLTLAQPFPPAESSAPRSFDARLRAPADTGSHAPPAESEEETKDEPRSGLGLGGWVLDRDGNAVAGLAVEALPRRLAGAGASEAASLAELQVVTDGTGRFAFERVPDGEYEVRTGESEIYTRAVAALRAGEDSAVLVVESRSGRTLHVHGVVASARGGPLKDVRVEVLGRPASGALSDDSGAYAVRLPVAAPDKKEVALRFVRAGYREQRVPIAAAEAAAGDVVRDVSLEPAGASAPVTGVVTGSDGPPVARASLQLTSNRLARRYQAQSDAEGRFAFAGVEESDDYRLWVRAAEGYRDHVREGVEVGPQGATLNVVVQSAGRGILRGAMVDSEARPVPAFTLWLRPDSGGDGPIAVTGDGQGRFEAPNIPEGAVTLQTRSAPQLTVTGVRVAAGPPREVRIPLSVGPHRVEGSVRDERGAPVGGARVSLLGLRTEGGIESRSLRETRSDARGSFVLTQLGSGAHTLSVTSDGTRGVRTEVQVGPGTPPLSIELVAIP